MAKTVNDEYSKTLKEEAIRLAKSQMNEIPFTSIYTCADILFDKSEMPHGDQKLAIEIEFLNKTKLEQVEYGNLKAQDFFQLINKDTRQFIRISNRECTRNEVRGVVLRRIINEQQKNKNAQQTLYDVISNALKDPDYSDSIVMMKVCLTSSSMSEHYGEKMTEAHFNLFAKFVLDDINKKIRSGALDKDYNPSDIRNNVTIRDRVNAGIPFESYYDVSKLLSQNPGFLDQQKICMPSLIKYNTGMNVLRKKAQNLRSRGYAKEAILTENLVENLSTVQEDFFKGDITATQFVDFSREPIQKAQHSALANVRGLAKLLYGLLNALLSVVSLGIANLITGRFNLIQPKKTDTIVKVDQLENTLNAFPIN